MSSSVHVLARAKLNLVLRVLKRRPDGFHEIFSWMQPIDWADDLTIRLSSQPGIQIQCKDVHVPLGPTNLICRAAERFAAACGRSANVEVSLEKRIPIGGGLGGGSADAAATILGLAALWDVPGDDPRLFAVAEQIGSDVPFFLGRGAAFARGRGERLQAAPAFEGWAVLIIPPIGVSTVSAYAACRPAGEDTDCAMGPWSNAAELALWLRNDLTSAAFAVAPRLSTVHARVDGLEGVGVQMSGSGSTLFALFDDEAAAGAWLKLAQQRLAGEAMLRAVRVLNAAPCEVRRD